ncbi:hypothetical protein [Caproiciproducens faecalis]|uniref:Mannosyl-glycoprotein endo-beta-N-acetylglucosaminidase n=1 Tax=Caproiciproducens faecalis TaxID=2820301 RepID=A0ABS7DQ72_9FIRM|nr:hypothetical protein [Caproiciproducens faecalis]MBW7573423.1 hypothetical protein [Caproiciproducens faecalis]
MNPFVLLLRKRLAVFCALLVLTAGMGLLTACRSGPPKDESSAADSRAALSDSETVQQKSLSSLSAEQGRIESDLQTILSSPLHSSNPNDYIIAHQQEYERIVKQGETALNYLLGEFKDGRSEGLRGEVMKAICMELLGDKNNVPEGSYETAQEWYEKFVPLEPRSLPKTDCWEKTQDEVLNFVYTAALNKYDPQKEDTVTIAAPVLYGSETQGTAVRAFATVYVQDFQVIGNTVCERSGAVIPAAISGTLSTDGRTVSCTGYTQAKDGSDWAPSIREFCGAHKDIAEKMIAGYSEDDFQTLMKKNLQYYLQSAGITPAYYSDSIEKVSFSDYLSER